MFSLSTESVSEVGNTIPCDGDCIIVNSHDCLQGELFSGEWINRPVLIEEVVVSVCISGSASLKIGIETYKLEKDSVLMAPPGMVIEMQDISEDCVFILIVMKTRFLTINDNLTEELLQLFGFLHHKSCYRLQGVVRDRFMGAIHDAIEVAKWVENPRRIEMLKNYVRILYDALFPMLDTEYRETIRLNSVSKQKHIYFQFTELLCQYYRSERSVKFYAEKMHLTPKYLSKVIYQECGITALGMIENYVILEAKALLRHGKYNIQQVSVMLNFPDQNTFGKFFKRVVGMTPKEYRK